MKAVMTFEYDTGDYEAIAEIDLMRKAVHWKGVVDDLDINLRNMLKHGEFPEEVMAVLQRVRDQLWDLKRENALE
jgi:hypothetical protein